MSDRDPAVDIWRDAALRDNTIRFGDNALSTSAKLRAAESHLAETQRERDMAIAAADRLAMEHGKCVAQVERVRRLLREAYDANLLLLQERDEARAATADIESHRKLAAERLTRAERERDQARAQLAALPGYHLTEKGHAALTGPTQEQT